MKRATGWMLVASLLLLPACGGPDVVHPTVSVSIGQQLIDLKKARDSGALSEREYASQKAELIKNVD